MFVRCKLMLSAVVASTLAASIQVVGAEVADASVGAAALSSAQPDGRVSALAVYGNTIYLGGSFTHVKDRHGVSQARNHLAAISATSGDLLSWSPDANGDVDALEVAPGDVVYAGGDFTSINGQSRSRLAAFNGSTGALATWNPGADGPVYALAATSTRLYAGGDFGHIGSSARGRLAAFSLSTGGLDATWRPSAGGTVLTLATAPDGSRVYVGGNFSSLNGSGTWAYAAALNPASGAIDTGFAAHPGFLIYSITADSSGVYAGGGGDGGHLVLWRTDGSLMRPVYQTDGGVQAVAVQGGEVYAGGHYGNYCVGNTGSGKPYICNKPLSRPKMLSVALSTGQVTAWNPQLNSPHGVQSAVAIPASGRVAVGGDFTTVGGKAQAHFALFG